MKRIPKSAHPKPEMVAELQAVFKKHKWAGLPVGVQPHPQAELNGDCPEGKSPHTVSYQLPDGTTVTKVVCL